VLNAANEVAVHAFLNERLGFMGIPAVIERTLEALPAARVHSFDTLYRADAEARRVAAEQVASDGWMPADDIRARGRMPRGGARS
jgi:1-deoxy-D-xylulose-5-phosphate reductoisomerase